MRTQASLLRHPVAPEPSQGPSAELTALLDRLELLTGIPGMQRERDEVVEAVLDVFASHPTEAPEWARAWRELHRGR